MNKIGRTVCIIICFVGLLFGCSEDNTNTYPYTYLYYTTADNVDHTKQVEFIKEKFEQYDVVYESVEFEMLHVGTPLNVIVSNTAFNTIANYLGIDKVSLSEKDTAIITRYDDIKMNNSYIKKLDLLETYQLDEEKVNIVHVIKDKILTPGSFYNQFVVSDELYKTLNPNDEHRLILIYGYNVLEGEDLESLTEELATWEGFKVPQDKVKTFGFIAKR